MNDSSLAKKLDEQKFFFKPDNEPVTTGKAVWHKAPTEEEMQPRLSLPSGMLGEIARFIFDSSFYPNVEVAIAGALAVFAAMTQRCYNVNGSGLNLYLALLAATGMGKEAASSGISKLFKAVSVETPGIYNFMGPSDIASSQALLKYLGKECKSFFTHKGEVGFWLQKMNSRFAQHNDLLLKAMLLDCFHKSGQGQILQGSIYSDNTKNAPLVVAPGVTILGDSTPDEFYKAIDERSVKDGLVSRMLVIACPDVRPPYQATANLVMPSPQLVSGLGALAKWCLQCNETNWVVNVGEDVAAHAFQLDYQKRCQDKVWEKKEAVAPELWNRAHIKVLRIAALVAIGNNPQTPIITVADYLWAKDIVERGISAVLKKFESGDVGVASEGHEQRKLVNKVLREFYDAPCYINKWQDHYSINKDMWIAHAISYRMILNKVAAKACFKNSHNYKNDLRDCLDMLCEAGTIEKQTLPVEDTIRHKATVYQIHDRDALSA